MVFVSYIRRYVLTDELLTSDCLVESFRLLYSEICSYWNQFRSTLQIMGNVFVSYIRRYVLTLNESYHARQAKRKLFSSPIFGDMFLLCKRWYYWIFQLHVFVSYIRRYVLTCMKIYATCGMLTKFSSPIFGDMFLLNCLKKWMKWWN